MFLFSCSVVAPGVSSGGWKVGGSEGESYVSLIYVSRLLCVFWVSKEMDRFTAHSTQPRQDIVLLFIFTRKATIRLLPFLFCSSFVFLHSVPFSISAPALSAEIINVMTEALSPCLSLSSVFFPQHAHALRLSDSLEQTLMSGWGKTMQCKSSLGLLPESYETHLKMCRYYFNSARILSLSG